jgi:hypothetical protein
MNHIHAKHQKLKLFTETKYRTENILAIYNVVGCIAVTGGKRQQQNGKRSSSQ